MQKTRFSNFNRANYIYFESLKIFGPALGIRLIQALPQRINVAIHRLRSVAFEAHE